MRQIQVIELHGRPVALALGDEAILADHITDDDRPIVAGMALYAIEIQAGARPGPYSDADAERYARRELALRTARALPRPRRGQHARTPAR
jgi:hypothetical protein